MGGAGPLSYVVAVRALCEFTAREGDLDLRFTPSPSARDGIAGHALVAGRRGPGYESEVSLSAAHGALQVRGRADGYDPLQNLLEEVKTHRGELAAMPANQRQLHWAQARVYGHLLCLARGLAEVELALVYFELGAETETVLREHWRAEALAALFAQQCERFLAWAGQEARHRSARDAALATLAFPHAAFKPGQRALAETIFKANSAGRCVLAQAPTGIGKTVGALFPTLKAAPRHGLDKVFFLAAKTPGRQLALDALATIADSAPGLPLRVLELVARDKVCEHPDKACHGQSCPLARGFYDRLPAAREAVAAQGAFARGQMREVALAHQVCPYYLASEMALWSDLVVADYNYYFDRGAMLYALTAARQWRVSVLVDEAHNLVARARKMYSAELDRDALRAAGAGAPAPLKKALTRVARAWGALERESGAAYEVLPEPPARLLAELQGATSTITDFLVTNPAPMEPALQRFYFDALQMARLAESFGPHSLFDITRPGGGGSRLCVRNIVPAPFLAPRFAAAHASALFSATLSPWHYYSDSLGLPLDTVWIDVESPFDAGQLAVHVVRDISTRFQHRDDSLAPIADLIARQYAKQPGNYLAFFSSFDYLEQVAATCAARHPALPLFRQERAMDEARRAQFLARFTPDGRGVGFAVLGGAFGEGIDLPGARLIGAFIATLGLPQINAVNEQVRQRMQASFGAGYDYTYLYPGIQKVVQAAGRVIRTGQDVGVVYLIDDRFARPEVRQLLPRWWRLDIDIDIDNPGVTG
ncbi:ATP-dependent DNA helicase [Massilia glaciei]|uniref:ATP-dependent DNA helicase n=1 Tax=Massilia glaciei TaxID=1524097 RepID=A0A2U2HMG1_9BURK|nr:ATP-dependent DNA helicase [Massilia glaciei]PWF48690.1 ATP-dependent DNA helicase [Massilia glaciei]